MSLSETKNKQKMPSVGRVEAVTRRNCSCSCGGSRELGPLGSRGAPLSSAAHGERARGCGRGSGRGAAGEGGLGDVAEGGSVGQWDADAPLWARPSLMVCFALESQWPELLVDGGLDYTGWGSRSLSSVSFVVCLLGVRSRTLFGVPSLQPWVSSD